jgi:phage gp36-like protein
MAYSSESDLNLSAARVIELTESDSAIGVKDSTLLALLHVRATSKVDAALYGRYVIDADDFPPILTQLEADLWRYYIYGHREVMETPKEVTKAYEDAVALLERYRTGMEHLPAAHVTAATGPAPTSGSFSDDSCERAFGRAKDGLF